MSKGLLDEFIEGELSFRPTYKFDPMDPDAPVLRSAIQMTRLSTKHTPVSLC